MVETSDVRRKVRAAIQRAQQLAAERRVRVATATREGEEVLTTVATPVFRTLANVLRAEGFPFRVETPPDAVRLAADGSGQTFIELGLDTAADPPQMLLRVSRTRGRRVLLDETVASQDPQIAHLTQDALVDLVVSKLGLVM